MLWYTFISPVDCQQTNFRFRQLCSSQKTKNTKYHTVGTVLKYHTVGTGLKYHTVGTVLEYHTVGTVLKYHTVGTVLKYHTVGTVPNLIEKS